MKKITFCIMAICLSLTFMPVQSNAANSVAPTTLVASKSAEAEEANALVNRLEVIKGMDKSNLTFSEKRNLRKEVRSIRERLSDIGGGVYISAGAVILIIVLLIIFL